MKIRASKTDPLTVFRYSVFIEDIDAMGFSECSGLGESSQVVEQNPQDSFTPRLIPGTERCEPIVLSHGLAKKSVLLYFWRDQVYNAIRNRGTRRGLIRRNLTIKIKEKGNEEGFVYRIKDAWPSSMMGPDLNAMSDEIAIIKLTLQHEGIDPQYYQKYDQQELDINIPIVSNRNMVLDLPSLRLNVK